MSSRSSEVSFGIKSTDQACLFFQGFGDTLRISERNTVMVPIAGSRHTKFAAIADSLGEYPVIRTIIGTVKEIVASFIPRAWKSTEAGCAWLFRFSI